MATPRPDDLVPVREAARVVGRGYSTVRAWIAGGELVGWKGEGTHPDNAPTLVSKGEILALAARSKSTHPGRPATSSTSAAGELATVDLPAPVVAELRAALALAEREREAARVEVAIVRAELAGKVAELTSTRETLAEVRARVVDLSATVEAERARARGAEADRDALRAAAGLPWWRRLLGTSPALPGPGDEGSA